MWDVRPIEQKLHEKLLNSSRVTQTEGEEFYSYYVTARKRLVDEILNDISRIENSLTDHGPDHIANVLDNIYKLLDKEIDNLTELELYCLCLMALFHDVGNIHGRKNHYDKKIIYQIYSHVRGDDVKFNTEKHLVATAASAHSGKASDGSNDKIKELPGDKMPIFNHSVNVRKLAAILRFADELAEGIQRTSDFMLIHHKYDKDSLIHHEYAKCTNVTIERNDNRIALTYFIKVSSENKTLPGNTETSLRELLNYIYYRIQKLNAERIYNKYYCFLLSPFVSTSVQINIEIDGVPEIGLKRLDITDAYLLEDLQISIPARENSYEIDNIINLIRESCKQSTK